MSPNDMRLRTKKFAIRIVRLVEALPSNRIAEVLGKQLLRSGTAVGANYRSACRAQSSAHFIAKMKIVEEECDESIYWMELVIESGLMKEQRVLTLISEGNQLLAMIVASIKTVRQKSASKKQKSASRNIRQSSIVPRQSTE
jgi:four helix bundle protein